MIQPDNRFPDCLSLKLHGAPVQFAAEPSTLITSSAIPVRRDTAEQIELRLTIRFGDHEIPVPAGCVKFGLRRGELKLKLENGVIPLEEISLTAPFEVVVEVEVQKERGRETEANVAVAAGLKTKESGKESTKTKRRVGQVISKGTETEPGWVFEAVDQPILKGQLTKEVMGIARVTARPCRIQATFEVRGQRDIYLTEASGLWSKDISRNKRALLERELFLRFIAPKLQPYLSCDEVQYE